MKILILQLARLGDIYQTWPVLRALKRLHPNAKIHFLTRSKFAPAAPGSALIEKHWMLDTKEILLPLIDEKPAIPESLGKLHEIVDTLKNENFERIVNLSFSPFSSHLVKEIATDSCEVRGYTRTNDGYLSIPDDGSAYFYAQAGIGRPNRLHVTDLFSFITGVDLTEADWAAPEPHLDVSSLVREIGEKPVVIHIGASDSAKTLNWSKWMQVARGLLTAQKRNVILIGSQGERALAEKICSGPYEAQPVNLVGQTNLTELFDIIQRAGLLIGGDSAPIHIAGLTHTPVLNISFASVSFWETGPRSEGSRIMPIGGHDQVAAEEIVTEAIAMLDKRSTVFPIIRVAGPTYPYVEMRPQTRAFEWELLRAIYMSTDFPPAPSELFLLGMKRLADVIHLGREQLATLRANPANTTASAILDRVDEIVVQIAKMVPEVSPLVRWFQTELLRIGPMQVQALIETTDEAYHRLAQVIELYIPESNEETEVDNLNVG